MLLLDVDIFVDSFTFMRWKVSRGQMFRLEYFFFFKSDYFARDRTQIYFKNSIQTRFEE